MLGIFNLQGLVLFALYTIGIAGALVVGWVTKRIRGLHHGTREAALLMEMPVYRLPSAWDITLGLWERARIFLARLTGLILALTVLMWCITHYPLPPQDAVGPAIDYSFAGYLGRAAHVVFSPLGFNWQITLALIPAFAARETAVTALATVYAVGSEMGHQTLVGTLSESISLASALALMMWFVFAPQCMSTLAVIRRETGGWKWAAISFTYMFALAYVTAFITYRIANYLL
jgi:ferrous iron transport protein B